MANLQGYTQGAVGHMLNHYSRHDGDPHQEHYRYGNQKIDPSRTHLNYALCERPDPREFISRKVEEADTKPNKTTNVISDWVVTLPKNPRLKGREREFFEQAYEFLGGKVGGIGNVVGAYVHMDETSPHMHFCFVPSCETVKMTNDKSRPLRWTKRDEMKNPEHKAGEVKRDKKGTVRYKRVAATDDNGNPITSKTISQSKMFSRSEMQDFHPALSAHMERHFGFDVGIELEDEGDKLLSKLAHGEYIEAKTKLEAIRSEVSKEGEEISRLRDRREEIKALADEESSRLESLQRSREGAEERVEVLEAVRSECGAADAAPLSRKGSLLGRVASLCSGFIEQLGARAGKLGAGIRERFGQATRRNAPEAPGGSFEPASRRDFAQHAPSARQTQAVIQPQF